MLCSPAEIERKRQEALQKLANRTSPKKLDTLHSSALSTSINKLSSPSSIKSRFQSPGFKKKPYEKTNFIPEPGTSTKDNISYIHKKVNTNFYGLDKKITTTMILLSSQKFSVKTSAYFPPVFDILKTIPSKNYDPKNRTWNFPIQDFDTVVSKLNTLGKQIILEPLPKFVVNCLKETSDTCEIDPTKIDELLYQTLLPFQIEGLHFGIQRGGRCLIADDMGLGKTFQALAIMNYYRNDWPLLIVTTASMKNVWEETILKYIPSISIMEIQYMITSKDYIGNSSVLIVSHDHMSRCCDKLLERGFGSVIIDESHNLKNHKAKVTQAAIKLCKRAKRVVLLSGTPALSRPNELYSQLALINEKFFGSFFQYAKRYCDLQQTHYGVDTSGKSNLHELEIILKKKFMIRRRKDDVLGTLPQKTQEVVKLDVNLNSLDATEKALIENLSRSFVNTAKARDKHAILLTFFAETGKIKIPSVCSYIQKILESKKKFLVFAHHLVMLDAIEEVLKLNDCKYIRIDGRTSGGQRKYFVDTFQIDENCKCALLSITAANAGITLTAGQLVVFAELHWNPSILSQAEARVHRIGQENAVLVQYLLADGTADDHIWPLLQEKQRILQEMGLTKESFTGVYEKYQDARQKADGSIMNYFKTISEDSENKLDDDSILDDGLDDILCNIEI
ncbi:unnamed protein product [Ceutorhynchus assimilis]|uniref:SWI/SNF-related matrix-associated actin-dependent regulator of chromatin subfamily A-like protein 1 n=1 Tax=Ceutorhynchus assimilis TaxID=467358 RepID=A0A9N9QN19_9CUCU|nr:unnamed protein product [Ceutorhynchus assimilis]